MPQETCWALREKGTKDGWYTDIYDRIQIFPSEPLHSKEAGWFMEKVDESGRLKTYRLWRLFSASPDIYEPVRVRLEVIG